MITIPLMTTVADLQRSYRKLVNKIKESGEPMIVISNGKPDVVVMDVESYKNQVKTLKKLQEDYLLKVADEGMVEYKAGKTTKLKKNQTLLDVIS